MTRALVWKELREQRAVWLAAALATVGGMAWLRAAIPSGSARDEVLTGLLCLSAWGYGLVCGALLLAGEAEDGTQAFLDSLPASRRRLWGAKALTGFFLLAALVVALFAVDSMFFRSRRPPGRLAPVAAGALASGATGLAWGLYSGSGAATVLGAIARAVLLQGLATLLVFSAVILTILFFFGGVDPVPRPALLTTAAALAAAGAAARSRTIYSREDRLRRCPARTPATETTQASWLELLRLSCREAHWPGVGMALLGVCGAATLEVTGGFVWPVAPLVIGAVCGATTSAAGRPSDVRVPPGRALLCRVVVCLVIGLGAAALPVMGPVLTAAATAETEPNGLRGLRSWIQDWFSSDQFSELATFLAAWLVYGYAVGLLTGLVVPRPLAAAAALLIASPLGLAGLLFVLSGSAPDAWQVWRPPAVLLCATFLLVLRRARGPSAVPVGVPRTLTRT